MTMTAFLKICSLHWQYAKCFSRVPMSLFTARYLAHVNGMQSSVYRFIHSLYTLMYALYMLYLISFLKQASEGRFCCPLLPRSGYYQ